MCRGLGEEECTKFRKKKKEKKGKKREKKEINLIAAKSGLVGMKGYLETYNQGVEPFQITVRVQVWLLLKIF